MPQPLVWNRPKVTGNVPSARCGHTLTKVGDRAFILFGGFGGSGSSESEKKPSGKLLPSNQVFVLRNVQNSWSWALVTCTGDAPLPRTNHAAVAIQPAGQILIFGGQYSSNQRLNDVHILKVPLSNVSNGAWSQPKNQKPIIEPKNTESKIGAPEPRCNCTITYLKEKNKVYVFGGHGGVGYQKKSFNDLYSLDCETFEWLKIEHISGSPNRPAPRGGHIAAIMPNGNRILYYGGWSSTSQYSNCFIYDADKNEWTEIDIPFDTSRWNLASLMVPALPTWKLFIFGGSFGYWDEGADRNFGSLSDDTYFLDIIPELKDSKFKPVVLENSTGVSGLPEILKPKGRENTAIVYDHIEQRLILFGGWSNNWLNDLWVLNISQITGPDYAIYDIKPSLGPCTGKTKVSIKGAQFKQSASSFTIRFQCGKFVQESPGQWVSDSELICETPSFESIGAREAEVRVIQERGDQTLTFVKFKYYLNTKADQTISFGPGLLKGNKAGVNTMFMIQTRNVNGENRKSGADEFQIKITYPKLEEKLNEDGTKEVFDAIEEVKDVSIEDLDTGQYKVTYGINEALENVKVDIQVKNEKGAFESIRGSPFDVSFLADENLKDSTNLLNGPLMESYITGKLKETDALLNKIKEGIDTKNKDFQENIEDLLKIKKHVQLLDERKKAVKLDLAVIEQALETLEQQGYLKKKELDKSKKLIDESRELEKLATKTQVSIHSNIVRESEKTQTEIHSFEDELKRFMIELKKEAVYQYATGVQESEIILQALDQKILKNEEKLKKYEKYSKRFDFPDAPAQAMTILKQIKTEKSAIALLWEHIKKCHDKFEDYKNLKWENIQALEMADEIKALNKELMNLKNVDKKSNTFVMISLDLRNWSVFLPLFSELQDNAMIVDDDRHWNKVKDYLQSRFELSNETPLSLFWDFKIYQNKQKEMIEEITEQAKQERKIENSLKKIAEIWSQVVFEKIPLQLKDGTISLMKMSDENIEVLEEHQLLIQNIGGSKFMNYFERDVNKWQKGLANVNDSVTLLSEVQKTWRFLLNLFIYSEEVKKELPQESEDFVEIDKQVKNLLANASDILNIDKWANQENVCDSGKNVIKYLETIETQLAKCQKGLNDFIARKRRVFPRFYFLTMEELLDILANGNNPLMLFREKNYMSKIVQAIDKLELKEYPGGRPAAVSFNACVGVETITLVREQKLEDKVEIYLQHILNIIIESLNKISGDAFAAQPNTERVKFIEDYPAQLVLLINMVYWVKNVEIAFGQLQTGNYEALKVYYERSITLLTDLIKMVQGQLSKPVRQKVMCLITMDTHSRDVVERLINENVKKAEDFQWQSQLKMYWHQEAQKSYATINVADATILYGNEYLGNGARLVVTPLTDRIYVTATQALHLKMGCAPAGPAGTGKTETTKDLASACGKACYVFNCSPEMDYITMGNIFKGLAASGSWGCFDEFNRLVPEVLSVCSVQFKFVTDAIKADLKMFKMEGDEIPLDKTCGAFITMNPGYLGRSELPEGLKALFRPITVVVPDLELICENSLMAEGFVDAKILAHKFVTLYSLCNDLLSKADHYDWGLRAIKSVLRVAGTFKRNEPDISEEKLLFRALRDFNLPKIAQVDLNIFRGLLGDLFPSVEIPRKVNEAFEGIIRNVCVDEGLTTHPEFVLKVVQLGELLEIRHCVFLIGPPGSGKTSTWKILAKANDKNGQKTLTQDLDPKVVSTKELYGYTNQTTKEWKNGLLSYYMQYYSEEIQDKNNKWIILDGDLDANWIESMNSVMDDNKLLTLANNGRIVLKDYMRLLFEIRDLKFASLATVTRAGILYISDDVGYQRACYISSWINKVIKNEKYNNLEQGTKDVFKKTLAALFEKYSEKTIEFLKKETKVIITVSYFAMTVSLCKGLEQLILKEVGNFILKENGKEILDPLKLEHLFVYVAVWSYGGHLAEKDARDYRKDFSNWWRSEMKVVKFPQKGAGLVFDYFVDFVEGKVILDEWKNRVITLDYDTSQQMQSVTVPIPETVALSEFTRNYIFINHPVMLLGLAGSGKTQMMKGLLKEIRTKYPNDYYFTTISFNYFTDSVYLQSQMESELVKQGTRFGPKKGQKIKLIYFIDDLNMPQLDKYNTQTSIALLRQHLDYRHWYDISKQIPILKDIINTQVVSAMNPSAGSFYVNPRYQRHFWIAAVITPDQDSLIRIFNTFLSGHFKKFKGTVAEVSSAIVKAAIQLHERVVGTFRKTAFNFHYEFTIRHIANIFQGMLMSLPAQFQDQEKIVKLWIHESERIYSDRLVSLDDISKYKLIAGDVVKKTFARFNMQRYFATGTAQSENLIFCHFTQGYTGERFYEQLPNNDLKKIIEEALKEYNERFVEMNLVLFEDAMKHVCRITRVVYSPAGHVLLVGVGGSGKQSLTKLAAFICNYTPFNIKVSSSYSTNDLKADLLNLYNKAGLKDEQFMFIMTDSHITNEKFLVYINDLLSSGEVAELYTEEDKQNIVGTVRPKVKAENKPDTADDCWAWFIEKVKVNLHMSLCFSPVGNAIRTRARRFPGLVNCTVIDWFHPWPQNALLSVADQFLKEVELGDEKIRDAIVKFMPYSFEIVNKASINIFEMERRYVYTTPKSFLELIKLFTNMLQSKRDFIENEKLTYERGLIKLEETESVVGKLEEDLKIMSVEVEEKRIKAEEVAAIVSIEKEKVEKESAKAKAEEAVCTQIKQEVSGIQANCEEEVAKIIPKVEAAMKILDKLDINNFRDIKALVTAPHGIDETFFAVMLMFSGVPGFEEFLDIDPKTKLPKKLDWPACRKLMTNPQKLVDLLKKYPSQIDQNLVPKQNFIKINEILDKDPLFRDVVAIGKKYPAAGNVLAFVLGMIDIYEAYMALIPRRKALEDANTQLAEATDKLVKVKAYVEKLEADLSVLVAKFNEANDSKNKALAEADKCQLRLSLANRLINALGSEKIRWGQSIVNLNEQLGVIVGDVLMASSFVSYVGPFSKKYREIIITENFLGYITKNKIPTSKDCLPINLLTNEAEKARWNNQGLPSDIVSIENGAILVNSERYPLMIDPQLQGITWIKEKEKLSGMKVMRIGQKNYLNVLEKCISDGTPVLFENMDDNVDAILNPIIARNYFRRGGKKFIQFQKDNIELNERFRLYMQTKLSNPHYPPEIQAEAVLINFTVTEEGLGDQLLTLVVGKERPDLAKKKIELIQQQNEFKIKLKELEQGLLEKLSNSQGDILADIALIENLEYSKQLSKEISEKVIIAKETEARITENSEVYRPAAIRGALIFFLLNELFRMNIFYMYSLESYVKVINRAIDLVAAEYNPKKKLNESMVQQSVNNSESQTSLKPQKTMEKKPTPQNGSLPEIEEKKNENEPQPPSDSQNPENSNKPPEENNAEEAKGEIVPEKQKNEESAPKIELDTEQPNENADNPSKTEPAEEEIVELSPRSLKKRVERLTESITYCSFSYVRRGLFEKHKLIFSSVLTLRLLIKAKEIDPNEVVHLIQGKQLPNYPAFPEALKTYLTEQIYRDCKVLEYIPELQDLVSSLEGDQLQWKKWFGEEKAEEADLPKHFKDITKFHKLMILKAMRPDRMVYALRNFVEDNRGKDYTEQLPFNMDEVFLETSPDTPMFFVLFPGVDPTKDVEEIAKRNNRKFTNISMGQGQEIYALQQLEKCAIEGEWIMLQNVHLMTSWLKDFALKLEEVTIAANATFRCFISSEPAPPPPDDKIIPESIMQKCIKVSNEAPQDIKANLKRAWAHFSEERIEKSSKQNEFKSILYALCFFHSLVLGRRKFGSQGWSRVYNFNDGDLKICADVLHNYLEKYEIVPYNDLKYIYGEIMYGGHITDNWDRRTCNTYLKVLIKPDLLQMTNIIPNTAPIYRILDPMKSKYDDYTKHIDKLPSESPLLFGMHPNAEINYLTAQAEALFAAIIEIQGAARSSGKKEESGLKSIVDTYKGAVPESYNMLKLIDKMKEKTKDNLSPYEIVCLQECERMNDLLFEIFRSLEELDMGLAGALNISEDMEKLSNSLTLNRVPDNWNKYFNKRPLASWYEDMKLRCEQLHDWTKDIVMPRSICISYMFNPMSFLTAIMQVTARKDKLPLDSMVLQTDVTILRDPETEITSAPAEGWYVHGMILEGAEWEAAEGGGYLTDQRLKILHPKLPIVNVISVPQEKKKVKGQYKCPVYYTTMRGPTYIFAANLNMESEDSEESKWILSGVAIILNEDL